MEKRALGSTGIEVSRIGLGCVTFGREISEDDSFRILDYAFEQGITLLDTAEAYGDGHSSERILGKWLTSRGCRASVVVQTKITTRFTEAHIREALHASLDRLGLDYIDSYLFHSYDPASSMEEAVATMNSAGSASLVRCYGCSNFTLPQLQLAGNTAAQSGRQPPRVIEPIYNLIDRSAEDDLFPYCVSNGIGITSYSPLGAGFLSGKYTEDPTLDPPNSRFHIRPAHRQIYCTPHGFQVLTGLRRTAAESGLPLTHLALGWAFRHPAITSVLIGATRIDHVRHAIEVEAAPLPIPIAQALDTLSRPVAVTQP